ncbi:exonuclease domain-containing protein [Streptomyces sp. 184]|uniref:exonuclease domain-containing protein n=1 Tax=Streptomyces sp. 184 TaxID=1827526 RepID=UPI003892C0F1
MTTLLLDRVLVVDVEATCWEGPPPAGMSPEIIEIGLCELDVPTGERISRRSVLVRPERSEVGDFCTRLTTLTPEQAAAGQRGVGGRRGRPRAVRGGLEGRPRAARGRFAARSTPVRGPPG